jgi:hypothetical protein
MTATFDDASGTGEAPPWAAGATTVLDLPQYLITDVYIEAGVLKKNYGYLALYARLFGSDIQLYGVWSEPPDLQGIPIDTLGTC